MIGNDPPGPRKPAASALLIADDPQACDPHTILHGPRKPAAIALVIGNDPPGPRKPAAITLVIADDPHAGLIRHRPDYSGRVPKIFSNLNLHGATPPRVQPTLGEWGPLKVPSTKQKKRMRIWVSLALLGGLIAIFLLGWYVYYVMTGSWGFGIGDDQQQLFQTLLL